MGTTGGWSKNVHKKRCFATKNKASVISLIRKELYTNIASDE